MAKTNIKLNKNFEIEEITYSTYPNKRISGKETHQIRLDLSEIKDEMTDFYVKYENKLKDFDLFSEILYAQYKYIEGIKLYNVYKPCTIIKYKSKKHSLLEPKHFLLSDITERGLKYYLYWRTKIFDFEYVGYNTDCIKIFENELYIGTINKSDEITSFIDSRIGWKWFEDIQNTIKKAEYGENYYRIENSDDISVMCYQRYQKYNRGDFKGDFDILRYGTNVSFSSYFLKKYNLTDECENVFMNVFDDVYKWTSTMYSFAEIYYAHQYTYEPSEFGSFSVLLFNRLYERKICFYEYIGVYNYALRIIFLIVEKQIKVNLNIYKESSSSEIEETFLDAIKYSKFDNEENRVIYFEKLIKIVYSSVDDYFKSHKDSPILLTKKLIEKEKTDKLNKKLLSKLKPHPKKITPREQFLNKVQEDFSLQNAVQSYRYLTESVRKNNKSFFYKILFGLWVIEKNSKYTFDDICEIVNYDSHINYSKNCLLHFNSAKFLDYVILIRKLYIKQLMSRYSKDFINTCLVIAYYLFYEMCGQNNFDFPILVLGEIQTYNWDIFDTYINNESIKLDDGIYQKNILDIEKYVVKKNNDICHATVIRRSYSKASVSIIKFINMHVKKFLCDINGIKLAKNEIPDLNLDLSIFEENFQSKFNKFAQDYITNLSDLLKKVIIHNTSLNEEELTEKLVNKYYFESEKEDLVLNILAYFYNIDTKTEQTKYHECFIDYTKPLSFYVYKDKRAKQHIRFNKYNLNSFYKNMPNYLETIEHIFSVDGEYDSDFDYSELLGVQRLQFPQIYSFFEHVLENNKIFQQWIMHMKKGEIILTHRKDYIYLLYCYFINRNFVVENKCCWNLLIMIYIWNYATKDENPLNDDSVNLLELIFDYYIVYCSELTFDEFKSFFNRELIFEGEVEFPIVVGNGADENYDTYKKNKLTFYNNCMSYKYIQTNYKRFSDEFNRLLTESLDLVDKRLVSLWKEYAEDFHHDLFNGELIENQCKNILFKRVVLTNQTVVFLNSLNENKRISESIDGIGDIEVVRNLNYFNKVMNCYSLDYTCRNYLCEYIFKNVESCLRKIYIIKSSFLLDDKKLCQCFNSKLYLDNKDNKCIYKEIKKAVNEVYKNNYLSKIENKFSQTEITSNDNEKSNRKKSIQHNCSTIENEENKYGIVNKDNLDEKSSNSISYDDFTDSDSVAAPNHDEIVPLENEENQADIFNNDNLDEMVSNSISYDEDFVDSDSVAAPNHDEIVPLENEESQTDIFNNDNLDERVSNSISYDENVDDSYSVDDSKYDEITPLEKDSFQNEICFEVAEISYRLKNILYDFSNIENEDTQYDIFNNDNLNEIALNSISYDEEVDNLIHEEIALLENESFQTEKTTNDIEIVDRKKSILHNCSPIENKYDICNKDNLDEVVSNNMCHDENYDDLDSDDNSNHEGTAILENESSQPEIISNDIEMVDRKKNILHKCIDFLKSILRRLIQFIFHK